MLTAIFFDLDNTLLDFDRGEARALSNALRQFGVDPTPAVLTRYHAINLRQWELLEEGVLTKEQVLIRRFELLFHELGVDCDSRRVCDLYESLLAKEHDMLPGAMELLEYLAPRYSLYLATNGAAAVQRCRLADAGIVPYFQDIFISEEIGFHKPDTAFFKACFDTIPDFDPGMTLMVGDSLTSDIRGGRNAGLRTCWLNRHNAPLRPEPDYTITALCQLPALLKEL